MKKMIVLVLGLGCLLCGCASEKFANNQVYVIESNRGTQEENFVGWIDVPGQMGFYESQIAAEEGDILLTVAPDGESYYVMTLLGKQREMVIKGPLEELVKISKVDKESKEKTVVAERVPFINKVSWNNTADMVGFYGGERLVIYDDKEDKQVLEQTLADEQISDFFWSPQDGNKLYIEQLGSTGGGLYYVDSQRKVELYETKEKIYYKALLGEGYYYATQWRQDGESEEQKEALYTILVDENDRVAKVISAGRYRDSYLNKVLIVGDNNFGLYYIEDFNQVSKGQFLTQDYLHDAKFVAGGNIAYLVSSDSLEGNGFELVFVDTTGKEISRHLVSGSTMAISTDGKWGYISGPKQELFDLVEMKKIGEKVANPSMLDPDLVEGLQGAVSVYCNLALGGAVRTEEIKRYFIDHQNPSGLAREELLAQLGEDVETGVNCRYQVVTAKNPELSKEGDVVTYWLSIEGSNALGHTLKTEVAWDLVKESERWYVFGLSTFSLENTQSAVLAATESFLAAQQLMPEVLGETSLFEQVQFWQKESLGLSGTTGEANMAKVNAQQLGMIIWLKADDGGNWQVQQVIAGDQIIYNNKQSDLQ